MLRSVVLSLFNGNFRLFEVTVRLFYFVGLHAFHVAARLYASDNIRGSRICGYFYYTGRHTS